MSKATTSESMIEEIKIPHAFVHGEWGMIVYGNDFSKRHPLILGIDAYFRQFALYLVGISIKGLNL